MQDEWSKIKFTSHLKHLACLRSLLHPLFSLCETPRVAPASMGTRPSSPTSAFPDSEPQQKHNSDNLGFRWCLLLALPALLETMATQFLLPASSPPPALTLPTPVYFSACWDGSYWLCFTFQLYLILAMGAQRVGPEPLLLTRTPEWGPHICHLPSSQGSPIRRETFQ